jgi:putative transcriptional regulator
MTRQDGNRIRAAREAMGLTQAQLAEAIGAGRVTINRIEQGTQEPTLDLALRIKRQLGETLDTLFNPDADRERLDRYHQGVRDGRTEARRAYEEERRIVPDTPGESGVPAMVADWLAEKLAARTRSGAIGQVWLSEPLRRRSALVTVHVDYLIRSEAKRRFRDLTEGPGVEADTEEAS